MVLTTVPADNNTLEELRNACRLKHAMMGNKLWESISSGFKIEIVGSKEVFQHSQEHDKSLLWDFIQRRINPVTAVGASDLKDEFETTKASAFENDLVKHNNWFKDTREKIIKEEDDGYNEYICSMLQAYLSCLDKEFVGMIKDNCRK